VKKISYDTLGDLGLPEFSATDEKDPSAILANAIRGHKKKNDISELEDIEPLTVKDVQEIADRHKAKPVIEKDEEKYDNPFIDSAIKKEKDNKILKKMKEIMLLLPPESLYEVAKVMRYIDKRCKISEYVASENFENKMVGELIRHLSLYREGEVNDQRSQLPHTSFVAFHSLMLVYNNLHSKS